MMTEKKYGCVGFSETGVYDQTCLLTIILGSVQMLKRDRIDLNGFSIPKFIINTRGR
jgi:hypothetical protein